MPTNRKWYRNLVVAELVVHALTAMAHHLGPKGGQIRAVEDCGTLSRPRFNSIDGLASSLGLGYTALTRVCLYNLAGCGMRKRWPLVVVGFVFAPPWRATRETLKGVAHEREPCGDRISDLMDWYLKGEKARMEMSRKKARSRC